jgi:hypothetical protein
MVFLADRLWLWPRIEAVVDPGISSASFGAEVDVF